MKVSDFTASCVSFCIICLIIFLVATNEIKRKKIEILESEPCTNPDRVVTCTPATVDGKDAKICWFTVEESK